MRIFEKEDGKRNGIIQACRTSFLEDSYCHRKCRCCWDGHQVFNSRADLCLAIKRSDPKREKTRNVAYWKRRKVKYCPRVANGIQQPKRNGNLAGGMPRDRRPTPWPQSIRNIWTKPAHIIIKKGLCSD